ncbi:hypothetical protein CLCR_02476 [Cladophialophora carrionii]|uniref:BTB domain-containing protein n=1 Tax=Cladophialophora carrionii TaxID=86049 RepID=A0A1C1CEP3_9EURO|nr:hypothetical protein CLCR_02476 [Cladophialophora carrionii]
MTETDDSVRDDRPAQAGKKRKADEMDGEAKEQGERPRVVEVIPNGDVTFKVGTGEEACEITASGVVVSLASEVFSSMLSSNFMEGRTKVISLPEDDPQSVLTFCQIVHHKAENLNHLDPEELNKLAVFADMRLCTSALRPWVVMRLSPLIERLDHRSPKLWQHQEDEQQDGDGDGYTRDNLEQLLPVMLLFQLEGMFWKSTRFLIWSTKPSKPRQEQNEKTENSIYDVVYDAVLQSARTCIRSLFASVLECVDRGFGGSKQILPCQTRKYGFLMCALKFKKVRIDMEIHRDQSVHSVSVAVRDIARRLRQSNALKDQMEGDGCTFGIDDPCRFCSRDFASDLEETVDEFLDEVPGICLGCYLSNDKEFLTLAELCDHSIRKDE